MRPIPRSEFLSTLAQFFAIIALPGVTQDARRSTPDAPRPTLPHPDPRPDITSENVLSVEALGAGHSKKVLEAYEYARTYPQIFDGLYCPCRCSAGKAGHRSLLSCYESTQPTGCGGCQTAGTLAGSLAKEEKTLAEIRLALDKKYS